MPTPILKDWTSQRARALLTSRPLLRACFGAGRTVPPATGGKIRDIQKDQIAHQQIGRTNNTSAPKAASRAPGASTRLGQITDLLKRTGGVSLEELCTATEWQANSVRGAIAGVLKKKGYSTASERVDGMRRYRISAPE